MPVRFIHKKRSKITYCDQPMYLDIETSHTEDNMKCWIVSIQVLFDEHYHLFRTPEELMEYFLEKIDQMKLSPERKILVYIHNASYDLSYLLPYIQRYLPYKDDRKGLYQNEHKIISYSQGCFEFRCTYLLSGVSLEKWSNDMNVEHKKQVGLYDYSKKIFQDTELDQNELTYDMYDVYAMQESFEKQLEIHNDTITSVPLTSTGYARRLLREECEKDPSYRFDYFLDNRIDVDAYIYSINSYAGGYTHTNRHLKSKVIYKCRKEGKQLFGGIGHRDFRSMYPSVIMCYPLPWGKPDLYYDIREHDAYRKIHGHNINIDDILDLYPEYSTISCIKFYGMRLKNKEISMPFMQKSKIFEREEGTRLICDNGRLLSMDKGSFITYIDNHTLKIIRSQYNVKYKVIKVIRFRNKTLPEPIARVIDKLFAAKSNYKIIHNEYRDKYGEFDKRTIEAGFELMKSKKLLNSIYGCFAQNPLRDEIDLDFDFRNEAGELEPLQVITKSSTREQKEKLLNDYYDRRSSFLHYPIGVFTTAIARSLLHEFITLIGYENTLYCDTDSIFYIKSDEIERKIEERNLEKQKKARFITNIKGDKIYYDVFEKEPDLIAFKGLHSKCYGFVTERNELKLTVAGVPERTLIGLSDTGEPIYLSREEELKGITKDQKLQNASKHIKPRIKTTKKAIRRNISFLDRLKEKAVFKVNSGMTAKYIVEEIHTEEIEGHTISTAGGCIINKLDQKLVHDWDFTDDVKIYVSDFNNEAF